MKLTITSIVAVLICSTSIIAAPAAKKTGATPVKQEIDITALPSADYPLLEENVRKQLNQAVLRDDRSGIALYSSTLESLAKARYLDNTSWVNDTVVRPIVEGFKPQIESIPVVAKAALTGSIKEEMLKKADFMPVGQAIIHWLGASNGAAAQVAVGDFQKAITTDYEAKVKVKEMEKIEIDTKPKMKDIGGDEWVKLNSGRWYNVTKQFDTAYEPSGLIKERPTTVVMPK